MDVACSQPPFSCFQMSNVDSASEVRADHLRGGPVAHVLRVAHRDRWSYQCHVGIGQQVRLRPMKCASSGRRTPSERPHQAQRPRNRAACSTRHPPTVPLITPVAGIPRNTNPYRPTPAAHGFPHERLTPNSIRNLPHGSRPIHSVHSPKANVAIAEAAGSFAPSDTFV